MEIVKKSTFEGMIFEVKGKIDTDTAPELQSSVQEALDINPTLANLTIDVNEVTYLSSAGLRALFSIQKKFNAENRKMVITNANETLKEVFEITGFSNFLNIE